jgi:hypothetical protein
MRIACFVGTLLATGGCAQLVGAEDPVAEFEVSTRVAGRYVVALDATSDTVTLGIYRFIVELEVDAEDRWVGGTWVALGHTGPDETDVDSLEFEADLANLLELNFEFDGTIDMPGMATPDGLPHRLIGEFDGLFPALDGETATTDAFCGDGSGTVSLPSDGTFQASFAAVRLEEGQDPPEAADARTDCADL